MKMMSDPSEQDASPTAQKEEEKGISTSCAAAEEEDDDLCTLSGDRPFFDIILSKSHVNRPHILHLPRHAVALLPHVNVPVVLKIGCEEWNTTYIAEARKPRFGCSGWRNFVRDNDLKCGDACIFQVMESSAFILRLRVMILRNTDYLPPQLEERIQSFGSTVETAIQLD